MKMRKRELLPMLLGASLCRAEPKNPEPDLEVADHDWGEADDANIRSLLRSVRREFLRHLGDVATPPLLIERSVDSPITYDQVDPRGHVRIGLNTRDLYWAQYSFQFAHEMVHVLAGHVRKDNQWAGTNGASGWLEESLCECGSLFALRAMSRTWETNAPYANWKSFAPKLADYASQRIEDPRHKLRDKELFADWLKANINELRGHCCQREKNTLIAVQMLPVFEKNPDGWASLLHFRRSEAGPQASLSEHFRGWARACPDGVGPFVQNLAKIFGVD